MTKRNIQSSDLPSSVANASQLAGVGVFAETANYQISSTDIGKTLTFNGTSLTATLPTTAPAEPWSVTVINLSATSLSLTSVPQIQGIAGPAIIPGYGSATVQSDGTAYWLSGKLPPQLLAIGSSPWGSPGAGTQSGPITTSWEPKIRSDFSLEWYRPKQISVETFGVQANAISKTVSISGTAITGSGFLSTQTGMTIAIPAAGAPLCTGTLSSVPSTAVATTSLQVAALTTAMPPGDIFVVESGNTWTVQTVQGAEVGATSIPVIQSICPYSFDTSATISSPVTTLTTKVTYNSSTSLTATTAATNAVSNAPSIIGTDDTAAWQACLTSLYGYQAVSFSRSVSLITESLNMPSPTGGIMISGSSQQGSTIYYGGTGALFKNGSDDGVAWDSSSDYNGPQNVILENLKLVAVANTTNLTGEGVYAPGTIGFQDWRGGDVQLNNMWFQGFDFPFFGVKSDVNTWTRVTMLFAHSGMYLGPRSDQFTAINLYFEYCDRALDLDRVGGSSFKGCQFVDCGSSTTNPIRIRSAWSSSGSRGLDFDTCWFEYSIGKSASDQVEALIEVGGANDVLDAVQSYGVTMRHCMYLNNNSPNPHTNYVMKAINADQLAIEDPNGDSITGNNYQAFFEVSGTNNPRLKLISAAGYSQSTYMKAFVNNGTGTPLLSVWSWSGVAGASIPSNIQTGAYTFAITDSGLVVESTVNSAVTFTIPANSTTPFPLGALLQVCQVGTGAVTIAGASGVTVYGLGGLSGSLTSTLQGSVITLRQRVANQWFITGNLGGAALTTSQLGAANGVASLDATGHIPVAQLTVDTMEYLGAWNASTNSPSLTNGTGLPGSFYEVSVAGTQNFGAGSITFVVGDHLILNPSLVWERIPLGASGAGTKTLRTASASTTIASSDSGNVVQLNATNGSFSQPLPAGSGFTGSVELVAITTGSNQVTLQPNGSDSITFPGQAASSTVALGNTSSAAPAQAVEIIYDSAASTWRVI
jgi:hypothetical protein